MSADSGSAGRCGQAVGCGGVLVQARRRGCDERQWGVVAGCDFVAGGAAPPPCLPHVTSHVQPQATAPLQRSTDRAASMDPSGRRHERRAGSP